MSDDRSSHDEPAGRGAEGELFENLGRKLDELPAVQAAEQALRRATAELHRAQERYQQVRAQAVEQVSELREKSAAELLEATLESVRKHPGPGVAVAAFVGFMLGRLFRR